MEIQAKNSEIKEVLGQFQEYLQTEEAKKHIERMSAEKQEVKSLMEKLSNIDKKSSEFVEWVLYGLLPYSKTKYAKRVSLFPAFMNIKLFFKDFKYSDEEWYLIANKIYNLAYNFKFHPENLKALIDDFTKDKYSRALQCGSISPILFCLNDKYPVVNNRTIRAFRSIARLLGLKEETHQKLKEYPENIAKINKLVDLLGLEVLKNQDYFDLFCYWYDSKILEVKRETESIEEEGEIVSETEEEVKIKDINIADFIESINLENASKFSPHSLRNPERIKIFQIIDKVSKTEWVLPHFQRYFDWRKRDVRDFLESIFNDYYVGAFLLWDTEKEAELDIMSIKGVEKNKEDMRTESIILDGQQRITALYYSTKAPSFHLRGSNAPLYFYINFSSFLSNIYSSETIEAHARRLTREESYEKLLFPFYELEKIDDWVDGFEDFLWNKLEDKKRIKDIRRLIERKLKHIWNGFEIPYISLPQSMEISQVTDIFERINTKGKLLSVFDLLIARLYKYEIELKGLWDNTLEEFPDIKRYYKAIEKMPIYVLQSMSLCYHPNSSCQREDILNIYRNIYVNSDYSFDDHWREMSGYINKAIEKLENLRDGFGAKNEKEIPFEPIIPVLAALLREIDSRKNKADCYKKLSMWYWSSIFTNSYSQSADTQMTTDFKEMRTWFEDHSKLPRTINQMRREFVLLTVRDVQAKTSARYRGIMSLLALEGAKDFATNQTLENARSNDKDHIFPKAKRADFVSLRSIDSILNMTWMSKETNEYIKCAKRPSVYVQEFINQKYNGDEQFFINILKTHLVNEEAYKHLKNDDFENFLAEREEIILEKIRQIVGAESIGQELPTLISPEKPFTNKIIFYSTIKSCEEYIYWIDKYFTQEGLELLAESVNKSKIKEIKIITSIDKVNERFKDLFKDFRDELKNKSIKAELRVIIDIKLKTQIHDRWIISKNQCFNIPSPDIIARGQYSEIKKTNNRPPFEEWWNKSLDIISDWDKIGKLIKLKNT